jgi:hypothetical protein
MISHSEAERLKEMAESNRFTNRIGVVLSLIMSLTAVAILSRNHVTNLLVYLPALAIPISLSLCFKHRIVQLGGLAYSAVLIVILGVAILFGT